MSRQDVSFGEEVARERERERERDSSLLVENHVPPASVKSDRSLFYDSCGMPASESPPAKKRSEARERLLVAASQLFYAEGINSVGIERLIKEGQVTLATFYRHFPSKVDLAVAYLRGAHDHIAARAA